MNQRTMRRIIYLVVALAVALFYQIQERRNDSPAPPSAERSVPASESSAGESVEGLHADNVSGRMVLFSGEVDRMLADDNEGSRHQRFIVRLASGHTVLIAHNIDLAPRVPLENGDQVEIYGQFENNDRGGVVHWTHHDPQKRHAEGYIRHRGRLYQ